MSPILAAFIINIHLNECPGAIKNWCHPSLYSSVLAVLRELKISNIPSPQRGGVHVLLGFSFPHVQAIKILNGLLFMRNFLWG